MKGHKEILEYKFDKVVQKSGIEYAMINGNDKLFFIKVGNGGNIYGYENKYLKISDRIHRAYGCSVLVAGNPLKMSVRDNIDLDLEFIRAFFPDIDEIFAFGHSKGGQMLVSYAYLCPIIKKVLAVNVPLMINYHKTKAGIEKFEGNKIHMVYGENDPSYLYIGILNSNLSSKFSYSTVENADHNFENMLEEFISLPEKFLFDI